MVVDGCKCSLVCISFSCQGVETGPKHTLADGGSRSGRDSQTHRHFQSQIWPKTCGTRRLLAPLPNLTDLKCDVWENAVATWSPELLLIRPIRRETVHLRQDGMSSELLEDPLRHSSNTGVPSQNFSLPLSIMEGFQ